MTRWPCSSVFSRVTGYCLIIGSLAGCQSEAQTNRVSSAPRSPQSPLPTLPSKAPVPQPISFQVKVDSPLDDLAIKAGSFVRKGDVIATPTRKRSQLQNQKRELEAKLSAMNGTGAVSLSTQSEAENITLAQKQLDQAQAALQDYEQKSPWTDFARSNLPLAQEEVQLTRLQNNLKQAQANLETARSRLIEKQAAIRQFQSEQNLTKQEIQNSLRQVSDQIAALSPIKSEHTGTVTRLDIPKTSPPSTTATVTVVLMPGDSPQPILPSPKPSLDDPLGQPNIPPSSSNGSAIDLLPPDSSPETVSPNGLPESTAEPVPRNVPAPNVE